MGYFCSMPGEKIGVDHVRLGTKVGALSSRSLAVAEVMQGKLARNRHFPIIH